MIYAEYKAYTEGGGEFKFNFDPMDQSTLTISKEKEDGTFEQLCSIQMSKYDMEALVKILQAGIKHEEEDTV